MSRDTGPMAALKLDITAIVHDAEFILDSIARGYVPMNSVRNMRDAANRAVESGLLARADETY